LKHIKKFENLVLNNIDILANYLKYFMNNNLNYVIYTSVYNNDYTFSYNIDAIQRNYFMNLRLSTNNNYILFDIDTILQNPGWITNEVEVISKFIKVVMDKYVELGRIKCTDIDDIIKNITNENYKIYLKEYKMKKKLDNAAKKFNL